MVTGTSSINIQGTLFELSSPKVMGIVNVTTDSFYDGGQTTTIGNVLKQVDAMLEEGADMIDVGGASSRPGATPVSLEDELGRVLPAIQAITERFPTCIVSIDTNKAEVARKAVEAGAHIVNDISAGDDDRHMLDTVGELGAPYIAMHKQGTPTTMQVNPTYNDVVQDVLHYFTQKVTACRDAGIKDVILDPGFGFGKTVEHNYQLLSSLEQFASLLQCPILVGFSRKSMINKVLHTSPASALNGTTVLNTIGLLKGANIVRVHDVKEAKEAVKLIQTLKQHAYGEK